MSLEELKGKLSALRDFRSEQGSDVKLSNVESSAGESPNQDEENGNDETPIIEESNFLKGSKDDSDKPNGENKNSAIAKTVVPKKPQSFLGKAAQFIKNRLVDIYNLAFHGWGYCREYRKQMTQLRDASPADLDGEIQKLEAEISEEKAKNVKANGNNKGGGIFSFLMNIFSGKNDKEEESSLALEEPAKRIAKKPKVAEKVEPAKLPETNLDTPSTIFQNQGAGKVAPNNQSASLSPRK